MKINETIVDSISLRGGQIARYNRIHKTMVDGGDSDNVATREADSTWRTLYKIVDGKWVRRELARTTRGFAFAQRPGE